MDARRPHQDGGLVRRSGRHRRRHRSTRLLPGRLLLRRGDDAAVRLEQLFDLGFEGWRDRVTWRRRQVMDGRSGALDLPGTSWPDRPAVVRGDGVFLCGDQVAAPGCLAEVSIASALDAGARARRPRHDRNRESQAPRLAQPPDRHQPVQVGVGRLSISAVVTCPPISILTTAFMTRLLKNPQSSHCC